MIHVHLSVKFRAFGVTFGSLQRESLELEVPLPAKQLLDFSERGVRLIVGVS